MVKYLKKIKLKLNSAINSTLRFFFIAPAVNNCLGIVFYTATANQITYLGFYDLLKRFTIRCLEKN